jgi:lipoprotein-anchoring transpeptidase ErfK/SrfK
LVFAALMIAVVGVGCGKAAVESPMRPAAELVTTVAQAHVSRLRVFDDPGGRVRLTLSSPDTSGARVVFVVRNSSGDWLQVELPVRPNGSLGWISRRDVDLTQHSFRIVVELAAHMITVSRGSTIVDHEPVGIGTSDTPTPGGSYYTTSLIRPPDPNGFYGPYVYTLSGFSDVLRHFAGGEGVIGIHGTSEPQLIGKSVSHGCIRMSNAGITKLAGLLPIGVPVDIRP